MVSEWSEIRGTASLLLSFLRSLLVPSRRNITADLTGDDATTEEGGGVLCQKVHVQGTRPCSLSRASCADNLYSTAVLYQETI